MAWAGMAIGAVVLFLAGLVGIVPMDFAFVDVTFLNAQVSWLVPVIGLSLVAAAVAYVAGISAARRLGAKLASFVGLTEVLFAVLIAWLTLGQAPVGVQLVGGALILVGVAAVRLDELRAGRRRRALTDARDRSVRARSNGVSAIRRNIVGYHQRGVRLCCARRRGSPHRPAGAWHDRQVTSSSAAAQHLRDLARLRRVRDRIDREYAQPLDVEALARGANMSAGHLSRQFRLAYGESPYGYLMTRRIERAMALLRRGDLSVTEVCFAVGCSSLGTFSTRFTELVGVPPSVYRREATRATAGMPPCVAKQVTRPIRNREARVPEPHLA